MPLISLVKATASRLAREGALLCREAMGGNGILIELGAAKALADIEVSNAGRHEERRVLREVVETKGLGAKLRKKEQEVIKRHAMERPRGIKGSTAKKGIKRELR